MYAETEPAYLYFQSFPHETHHFDEFCSLQKPTSCLGSYNLGGEGDLFKAPQPVIEEPVMTAAISMISCGENGIDPPQSLSMEEIESSIEREQLLSEVFYECRKDLLAKEGNQLPLSEVLSIKIPEVKTDDGNLPPECQILKSVSSGCLTSMACEHEARSMPSFLDLPFVDFGSIYGIRRSFSDGDIKTLGNTNISIMQSPVELPMITSSYPSEERMEKLSRYWSKKSKRNFGRKIKYACRKALADNQPRIRGRFAKTEEVPSLKKN